ncbi:MAG: carboxylesterase family protein [Acidobacteriota bacterium]|nr:carboxylesterase family protein [Acidobacteriota bacterium]
MFAGTPVRTANGLVEGKTSANGKVRIFEGVPFAAPPVGDLRWKEPQPAANWDGVRKVTDFGPRCMQANIYGDMVFRDKGPSEDCLYLNVWTPAADAKAKLPVMVWIYGGGFAAGASSEPRQDGEHLAERGVVVVSLNYRLGVFGFLAHPELAKESGHHAAGNYGLMDQAAALGWVQKNIAAFGGDPAEVTIFGESAGSFSVCAQMASPLTTGLFERAIGESGAFFGTTLETGSLQKTEEAGVKFGESIGSGSLSALRAKSAGELLKAAGREHEPRFQPNIDGYFLPEDVYSIYAAGKQRGIPLLAGWNADEGSYRSFLKGAQPTVQNYLARLHELFGDKADAMFKLYPAATDEQVKRSAQDLAGDQFIGYSTWKWIEMQSARGGAPVYHYRFEDAPPIGADEKDSEAAKWRGAKHSAEIEFVFEDLASKHLPWRARDRKLSEEMATYWTNFAKTGSPNGNGLPSWPAYRKQDGYQVMHLAPEPHAAADTQRARYELLDSMTYGPVSK